MKTILPEENWWNYMEMSTLSKVSQTDKYCICDMEAKGGLCRGNRKN